MRWSENKEFDGKLTLGPRYLRPSAVVSRLFSQNLTSVCDFITRALISMISQNHKVRFKNIKEIIVVLVLLDKLGKTGISYEISHQMSHQISYFISPDII